MSVWDILALLVMLVCPGGILFLCKKSRLCSALGAVTLCYAAGLLLSLLPLPYDKGLTQTVASVAVAIAIPLILFSFDVLSVRRLAGRVTLSIGLQVFAVFVTAVAAFFVADAIGSPSYAAQLSGMAMGLYTGGTPNLVAIGNALLPQNARAATILAANTADLLVGGVYFFLALSILRPLYRRFLGERGKQAEGPSTENPPTVAGFQAEYDYTFFKNGKKSWQKALLILLLAIACLGIGAALEILINGNMDGSLYIMVTVSVLGLALSFIPRVRSVKSSYPMGQYLILVFSLGLSMSLDLSLLVRELLPTLAFFASVQILTVLVHLVLCKLFRIDGGTALVTSIAGIYGPPFITPVANAYGDRSLIVPGIICGVFGLAVGNLLGIGLGSLLSLFS